MADCRQLPRAKRLGRSLAGALLGLLCVRDVLAGPNGATVVGGAAAVQNQNSANVIINQASQNAIINWQTFNIGVGETTKFNQPNGNSVILNRVTGGLGPSEILGSLTANGKVFVVNRDGIFFGPGATVSTAGFLATTSDIHNLDFMAGRYNFQFAGRPDASIVNAGQITATSGGFAALVAPGVRNSGTISATLGTVSLASGNAFSLDFYGDKLVTLGVNDEIATQVRDVATGQPLKSLVTNEGRLKANGGRVELTAAAARQVVDSVINTSGVIEAQSVGLKNGQIVLSATTASTKPPSTPVQTVKISGRVSAAGKKKGTAGGSIVVVGENIEIAGATIDASGREAGGKILIGGDWGGGSPQTSQVSNASAKLENFVIPPSTTVSVDARTTISVSSTHAGNGGKVILWSNEATRFAGTVLALGGKTFGNGGFVEVSSRDVLSFSGLVDTRAPKGLSGTVLFDPQDLTIWSGVGSAPSGSTLTSAQLQQQLALGNVVVATSNGSADGQNGDIFVIAPIVWNAPTTLTLSAFRNIEFSYPDRTSFDRGGDHVASFVANTDVADNRGPLITNTGGGNLILRADNTGTGTGTVSFRVAASAIDFSGSSGSVSIYYNPSAGFDNISNSRYHNPIDFTPFVSVSSPSRLQAYMLVNNSADLREIGRDGVTLSQQYALGRDFDATAFGGFPSGTAFVGVLDGFGGIGDRSIISNLTLASANQLGLFPIIGVGGIVRNLILTNIAISGGSETQLLGSIAGRNDGTIESVTVANGYLNATAAPGLAAGGLAGVNNGIISQSSAAVSIVADEGSTGSRIGGLVGSNYGQVTGSQSNSSVRGGSQALLGGLVGENQVGGLILSSLAFGEVIGLTAPSAVGGFAGSNLGTISGSTANVAVSGAGWGATAGSVGGFVGMNDGTIKTSTAIGVINASGDTSAGGFAGINGGTIDASQATGPVTAGGGVAGGLVGANELSAIITNSNATGTVQGGATATGGFAGSNAGNISNSFSTGAVSAAAASAGNSLGGFVGINTGSVSSSRSTGAALGAGDGIVGGFVGSNYGSITAPSPPAAALGSCSAGSSCASGAVTGPQSAMLGGFAGVNAGSLVNVYAIGTVVTAESVAGGLIGTNLGNVLGSWSSGAVTGGQNSILGGLVGINDGGSISQSYATSAVAGAAGAVAGGLVGFNLGSIAQAFATGAVQGGNDSVIGGLAAYNLGAVGSAGGSISQSYSISALTGQANSAVGGLVAQNSGSIDQTYAAGLITAGPGSTVGGLVAANSVASVSLPAVVTSQPSSSSSEGTITNSYWDTQTSGVSQSAGGTPQSTIQLTAGIPAGFSGQIWTSTVGYYPCLNGLCTAAPVAGPPATGSTSEVPGSTSTSPGSSQDPGSTGGSAGSSSGSTTTDLSGTQPTIVDNGPSNGSPLGAIPSGLFAPPLAGTQAGFLPTALLPQLIDGRDLIGAMTNKSASPSDLIAIELNDQDRAPTVVAARPSRSFMPPRGLGPLPSGMPPRNESRFLPDEVVVQLGARFTPRQISTLFDRFDLQIISSQRFELLGRVVYRLKIQNSHSVRSVIAGLEANGSTVSAQPSYIFRFAQSDTTPQDSDSGQYVVGKLDLNRAHAIATGKGVKIAVIDSEIDAAHPDLAGAVTGSFDALPSTDQAPHPHGTGMAGAIGSHQKLRGIAPGASILAVRSFGTADSERQGTSVNIVKGLEWAAAQKAKIVNMSFAGPYDPIFEQGLRSLWDKDIILVAAAGNAGPKSAPLFPAADPNVIAVSATDIDDKTFKGANRGKHIAIAAPGVDVIVPAPDGAYQLTTGTSVAAAEVSGVVALMLERNGQLTLAEVKKILAASAKKLPQSRNEVGAGLVDPVAALLLSAPKTARIN